MSALNFRKREDFDNRGESKGKTLYFGQRVSEFYCAYMIRRRSRKTKKILLNLIVGNVMKWNLEKKGY